MDPARKGREKRLAVVETAPVDANRKLCLVRHDDVEHLLII
jgi:flagellar protein FliO/FliZ